MTLASIPRSLAVLAAAVAVSASPSSARADASLTDGDAHARLEVMQATGALRDPFWAHAYWSRSREAPTTAARIADLQWAIRFDPELLATRWELTGLLLRERRADFVPTLVETLTSHATSFVGQRRFALAALTVGVGAALLSAVLLAILAIAKTLPRLHHALLERLRFLPREMRGPAAALTMAAPVALSLTLPPTAAAFWGTAFGTIAVWRFLDAWERRTCLTAMGALLAAPLALVLWTQLALPGLPSSYLGSLWETQRTADTRAGDVLARVAPPGAHGDPDWYASLALADRRAGRYAQAAERLHRAMELDPREWSYPNNLGNVLLLSGDPDGALAQYATARTLAPDEPLVRINEAQAWVKKLEFPRADEALKEAMRLGHHLPPLLGDPGEAVIVHDRVLDASSVWRRLAFGEGGAHALGFTRALGMSAGVVFPFRPLWLSLPLLLGLAVPLPAARLAVRDVRHPGVPQVPLPGASPEPVRHLPFDPPRGEGAAQAAGAAGRAPRADPGHPAEAHGAPGARAARQRTPAARRAATGGVADAAGARHRGGGRVLRPHHGALRPRRRARRAPGGRDPDVPGAGGHLPGRNAAPPRAR